ncbi:Chorismate synthase [Dillenia turbinata]|uniref:chorismate synthase n=1 Tax=Dillenia turbinata TaxID=194707 RepID=A0AAN8VPK5_9MAGN
MIAAIDAVHLIGDPIGGCVIMAFRSLAKLACRYLPLRALKLAVALERKQSTVTRDRHEIELRPRGRHDPCFLPQAVPVVVAMVALVPRGISHVPICPLSVATTINPALQEPMRLPTIEPAGSFL